MSQNKQQTGLPDELSLNNSNAFNLIKIQEILNSCHIFKMNVKRSSSLSLPPVFQNKLQIGF